ncbi:sensor histidine kinase [Pedobacter cryoconitis]|uniref:sensor histidine kinase n=1 Tax=Pedobacter cryoconitis TaxID=188932 RepID=UPI001607BBD7|nr:histidine kinase [Pedobacter cryoconitis]MBB5644659.1 signal transduction histidine kinase [Pedobacter cryoconitis]
MQETVGDNIFLLIILCTGGIFLLVISFVILFINNQKKLLRNRQQIHEAEMSYQKELMRVVLQSQEEERKRIGQDLHDDVGGSLSNLRMLINRDELPEEQENKAVIANHKLLIDKIIQDVRNISHNLSPPALALFGFTVALEELIDSINDEDNSLITLINDAEAITDQLPYDMALALIRVLQELISNTIKHGDAKRIEVSIFMENGLLVIQYRDEGVGYDPGNQKNRKGMGMQNIESRLNMINATYTMKTAPGSGFSMFIVLNSSLV